MVKLEDLLLGIAIGDISVVAGSVGYGLLTNDESVYGDMIFGATIPLYVMTGILFASGIREYKKLGRKKEQ